MSGSITWPGASAYMPALESASATYGVPSDLLYSTIGAESSFNPNAANGNALGIAQFMPGTASDFGVNTSDPISSINGAAEYLAQLNGQTGSWSDALQMYGTVPLSADLTAPQAQALNAAANADAAGLSGGYIDSSGQYVPPQAIPGVTPNAGAAPMVSGTASGQAAFPQLEAWIAGGFERGGFAVVAAVVIVLGMTALVFHSGDVRRAAATLTSRVS